jgi:muramoyltetrapeptide carboxypeptidase
MSISFPPALQAGQRVAIVSTARKILAAELAPAIATLESWGLEVVLGDSIAGDHHQFAGDDNLRRHDFQQQLDDPGIRAILCARGGYGTARIVDGLDFTRFAEQPKWVAGFSDITVLNCHLLAMGYASIHGVVPMLFHQEGGELALETLRRALFGEAFAPIEVPAHPLNRLGTATGELVGGNLSLLHTITGTASQVSFAGRILFLEDLDEYLYHIDRMMLHLHRSGQLAGLAGLVVGHFSAMRDNVIPFGSPALEIIDSYARLYNFPVGYGFPVGHEADNLALVVGQMMTLSVTAAEASITVRPAHP